MTIVTEAILPDRLARPNKARICAVALLVALGAFPASAAHSQGRRVERGDRWVGASAGASFYTSGGAHFAEIRERNVITTTLRAEWVIETAGPFALASTMDLVPLTVVSRRGGVLQDCWKDSGGRSRCQTGDDAPIFGIGGNPLGIKLYLANESRARLFTGGSVGLMVFNRDMPIAGSRQMNFAVEYGGGVEINSLGGSAIVMGWRFQHMSNGYTSNLNPGLDVNVLYLGLMRRRHT